MEKNNDFYNVQIDPRGLSGDHAATAQKEDLRIKDDRGILLAAAETIYFNQEKMYILHLLYSRLNKATLY
jgi:tRNA(Ile2) C34 agmatinyltransferase TiaS